MKILVGINQLIITRLIRLGGSLSLWLSCMLLVLGC